MSKITMFTRIKGEWKWGGWLADRPTAEAVHDSMKSLDHDTSSIILDLDQIVDSAKFLED